MSKWTDEELKIAYKAQAYAETINSIVNELKAAGFDRSYEAVRKMFSRNQNKTFSETKERDPIFGPKVLILDIETLPLVTYSWGIWKQNLSDAHIIKDWCLLSWSAKWYGDSKIYSDILTPEEAINRDDQKITTSIWYLLDEADIIVAHNAKKFDVKKLKTRFILNNLLPPSPYMVIDTLEQTRKIFGFTTNKLDYLGKLLLEKQKLETNLQLWKDCDNGDPIALKRMLGYNENDVFLLEDAFVELLPWLIGLPNFALYTDMKEPICGHCGSPELVENGFYYTSVNKYKSYRCESCGCFIRDRVSEITKKQKQNLKVNLSR